MNDEKIFSEFDYVDESEILKHYGTPRHSGRYPWGSGKNPQRSKDIRARRNELRKQGMKESEIAKYMGYKSTGEYKSAMALAKEAERLDTYSTVIRLKNKGLSVSEIGRRLGKNESSIRSILNPNRKIANNVVTTTMDILKKDLDSSDGYLDVTKGSELYLGVTESRLTDALYGLQQQGYAVHNIKIEQMGTGNQTTVRVLAPKGTTPGDIYRNKKDIRPVQDVGEYILDTDDGPKRVKIHDPVSISSKRVMARYDEDGGTDKDGVIELRRGVQDLDLGKSNYAQVRIAVDGTHYLKGMAVYSDDMPDGVDVIFNTNKSKKVPLLGPDKNNTVLKPIKDDPENPFGAVIDRQNDVFDEKGNVVSKGALNIVREEGQWSDWSRTLSSQFLGKQSPKIAKQQLDIDYTDRQDDFDEIMSLTNPTVKKRLLAPFADECDSAAVHLKAASFPRQGYNVILPLPNIKENQIYAPNYEDGEDVVLIRYPHAGRFEIAELTVNNRFKEGKDILGSHPPDAVGIHPKVAGKLSGADFDGDTVLVIPNNDKKILTSQIKELEGYEPKRIYKYPPDIVVNPDKKKGEKGPVFDTQKEMGMISNLITDMQLQGAPADEVARAVKHSMLVIDADKHNLNFKQSEIDNGIQELKNKYQPKEDPTKPGGGASSLLSRAKSEERVNERTRARNLKDPETGEWIIKEGINVQTGEKAYTETGRLMRKAQVDKVTGEKTYVLTDKLAQTKSTKMAETKDARTLMSGPNHEGTEMEKIYADYANRCKSLGNRARKAYLSVTENKRDPEAAKKYAKEVKDLELKLRIAQKNAPLERQAQILAGEYVRALQAEDPSLKGSELKKEKGKAIQRARKKVGAGKYNVQITDKEWEAIQNRAISPSKLKEILDNTDLDLVKQYAMPKQQTALSDAKIARIKAYARAGRNQNEIAEALGISTTTVNNTLRAQ